MPRNCFAVEGRDRLVFEEQVDGNAGEPGYDFRIGFVLEGVFDILSGHRRQGGAWRHRPVVP